MPDNILIKNFPPSALSFSSRALLVSRRLALCLRPRTRLKAGAINQATRISSADGPGVISSSAVGTAGINIFLPYPLPSLRLLEKKGALITHRRRPPPSTTLGLLIFTTIRGVPRPAPNCTIYQKLDDSHFSDYLLPAVGSFSSQAVSASARESGSRCRGECSY